MTLVMRGYLLLCITVGSAISAMEPSRPKVHRIQKLTKREIVAWKNPDARETELLADQAKLNHFLRIQPNISPHQAILHLGQQFSIMHTPILACSKIQFHFEALQKSVASAVLNNKDKIEGIEAMGTAFTQAEQSFEEGRKTLIKLHKVFSDTPHIRAYADIEHFELYNNLVPKYIALIEEGFLLLEKKKIGEKLCTHAIVFNDLLTSLIQDCQRIIESFDEALKSEIASTEAKLGLVKSTAEAQLMAIDKDTTALRQKISLCAAYVGRKMRTKQEEKVQLEHAVEKKQEESKKIVQDATTEVTQLHQHLREYLKAYNEVRTPWTINNIGARINKMFAHLDADLIIKIFNILETDKELKGIIAAVLEHIKATPDLYQGIINSLQNCLFCLSDPSTALASKGYEWEIAVTFWIFKNLVDSKATITMSSVKGRLSSDFSREFDITVENPHLLIECKNCKWRRVEPAKLHTLYHQFGDQKGIADELKYLFMVISRHRLSKAVRTYLSDNNILYIEPGNSLVLPYFKVPCNSLYNEDYCKITK